MLLLMAVVQAMKGQYQLLLDLKEINNHVSCHAGYELMNLCGQTLREW